MKAYVNPLKDIKRDFFNFCKTVLLIDHRKSIISVRIAIHKKKADGTAGDFLRWSDVKSVTVSRSFWIVGIGDVQVKPADSPDSDFISAPSEMVLLFGAEYTFWAMRSPSITANEPEPYWPGGKPVWTIGSKTGTDEIFEMTANSSSTFTLTYECGNTKTFTVTVVQPEVISVDFRGAGVQTIYDVGTTPEWVKNPARDEPFCAVKNQDAGIYAKFGASKNLTFPASVKVCEREEQSNDAVNTTWQNWPSSEVVLYRNMPNKITIGSSKFHWKYSADNGQNWKECGESTHKVYVTWDTKQCPDTDFTKAHIE
jgi:hypothetical protein